jgi:perosamine synthetase
MSEPIQFARPYYFEEEAEAAAAAVRSGWIVGGPRLLELESRFAQFCGTTEAIGVSSWTTGAFLVLHCWGIGAGDEVIVPSLTFIATANVVAHTGATPVFADIDPGTWNIDPIDVERKITHRTKAIIPVDQLGLPCSIDEINRLAHQHGLHVLQDSACALGSIYYERPVGGLSEVSVFSLHARKVITTGEGGMIVTNDRDLAHRLRRLRHQGMSHSDYVRSTGVPTLFETYDEVGYNFRLTDIQAAIGLIQFDRLPAILERRRAIADLYNLTLGNHPYFVPPHVPDGIQPNWQSYMITLRETGPARSHLMELLHARGVPTRRGVMACHLEPAYACLRTSLPHTEYAADNCVQLPMHPALTDAQQAYILRVLADVSRRTA